MALFCVSYDLMKDKDYDRIIKRLKELGAHRPLLSVWFLELNNTAAEIRDDLVQYMDKDDKLVVVEFHKRPATQLPFNGTKDWLDHHV